MSGLPDRLDNALNKRGYTPRSGRSKSLACEIGVGDGTLWRYRNGARTMAAETLIRLIDHFRSRGDCTFAAEIMGEAAPQETINYWATDKGELHRVENLAVYAAESRGLTGVAGDHAAVARRNLGWVSVAIANGMATVEYYERGISSEAVLRSADVLRGSAAVVRAVYLADGRRVVLPAELPRDAIAALEQAATVKTLAPPLPWRVERLAVFKARLAGSRLLCSPAMTTSDPVASLDRAGLLPELSLFRVDGEEVITVRTGSSSPLPITDKIQYAGKNIMARRDVRYAIMTRAHILDAARNGPSYHHLSGTIDGRPAAWWRPAIPLGNGIVATHTEKDVA